MGENELNLRIPFGGGETEAMFGGWRRAFGATIDGAGQLVLAFDTGLQTGWGGPIADWDPDALIGSEPCTARRSSSGPLRASSYDSTA